MWAHVKAWATTKVTEAVRETLTETPVFKAGRRAIPLLAAYIAASALLLSHALLTGTEISFASYVLLTTAACVGVLAVLLLVCAPSTAADIPLVATVAYVPLLAMQCMLASFATCIHQENRAAFAVASAAAVFLVVHSLVTTAFDIKLNEVRRKETARHAGGSEVDGDGSELTSTPDSAAFSTADSAGSS